MLKSDKHKRNISESMKGKYKDYVWITNGTEVHRVRKDDLSIYIDKGYRLGKKRDGEVIIPWNKGLTVEDERVKKYVDSHKGIRYKKNSAFK